MLKAKFGTNFVTSFSRRRNVKIGKTKIKKIYRTTSSILLRNFRVIVLKLSKLIEI